MNTVFNRSTTMTHMASVGIRSLQQNASAVVSRAEAGEVIDVTDRGRLVARLVPTRGGAMERLVAAGLIRPATRKVSDLPPPIRLQSGSRSASSILAEMRADER
jgi:prevent-host-death family protein